MPTIHLLILMIALAEMRFYQDPLMTEKISMNEAVELAKKFSDDTGRAFINGVLSQYQKHRDDFASETPSDFMLFQKSSEI
jgi:N utilization substance protein B